MPFARAVVRPPPPGFAGGLTTAADGPPDLDLALAQHGAYCLALARRYLHKGGGSMFPEIRRFYRLTQRGKLRRITAGP